MLVCTLGDLVLDVVVRLSAPLAESGDVPADIRLGPGGQAANVAAWAAELGASARLLCKTGADDAGALARRGLEARGVELIGPANGRTGIVCALVSSDGERSLAADRGASASLTADEIEPSALEGCDHVFVSGYALLADPTRGAARRAVGAARDGGAQVSVDLSSWSAIRDAGVAGFRTVVAELAPDVVFANEDEERVIGGRIEGPRWILKRGSGGCSFDGDERRALTTDGVVDSTGAGDALAAGYLVGGPELALEAASRCVAKQGSMP
jgi:sugar/nucleoside kinase (ribokinase family)